MRTATTDIYTYVHTLSLHDALPIWDRRLAAVVRNDDRDGGARLSAGAAAGAYAAGDGRAGHRQPGSALRRRHAQSAVVARPAARAVPAAGGRTDRKSTRLNSSH